ncbi:MAG: DHA2 family efflux MFS transporter permease subunit [Xanthobacteraceae bacterium]
MAGAVHDEGVVPPGINRIAITGCIILAVIMQALDTTIANVALPYMQGSVAASFDQISWVLTSYIVASAIMTPPSGFLTNRFGRKRVLLVSVAGFVVASMLCGAAQSLTQIVVFRLLQGCFGAALVPIAQAVMLDIFTEKERGTAMGVFGVAVMVGPVLGPVVGGWLTEQLNWRWIFYINLPLGALAFLGIWFFMYETRSRALHKFDWLGFSSLSLFLASLQLMLDRGSQLDWFSSLEIIIYAVVAASAFYVFIVHIFTTKNPFVNPRLFLDRNYAIGIVFIFAVGISYLASMALMTPYLQTLMGYPIITAGLVMGPRGLGTMVCMFMVGRMIGHVDTRVLLLIGLALTAWSMHAMSGWTPAVSEWTIAVVGFVQGAGLGFLFVPLTTVTFATLAPQHRGEAAGMYNLSRNIGAAVGISIVTFLLTRNTQVNHALIGEHVNPYNRALYQPDVLAVLSPWTAQGRAAIDQLVTGQATIIAYINDFKLMMILTLAVMPLVFLLKKAKPAKDSDAVMAHD